jgi:hypothetical protein
MAPARARDGVGVGVAQGYAIFGSDRLHGSGRHELEAPLLRYERTFGPGIQRQILTTSYRW